MVNTEITLIMFFAAKDGEALYSQQKQDQELTVAQIIYKKVIKGELYYQKCVRYAGNTGVPMAVRIITHLRADPKENAKLADGGASIW